MSGKTVVLTGVGRDRVGIVAELAQMLWEQGCNLLDSSMTLLRGEFALILMVALPENTSVTQLETNVRDLEAKLGMTIHVRELSADELVEVTAPENSYMLSVYGADRPGIVAGITRKLAEAGVNITDVQTKSTETDQPLFVMILEVTAPPEVSESKLKSMLKEKCAELNVDISVQSLDVVEL